MTCSEPPLRCGSSARDVVRHGAGNWTVHGAGVGGFDQPADVLDFGNSGTGVRLTMGAVATTPITVTFTGDASLRRRPMQRVLGPLALFGASGRSARRMGCCPSPLKGARHPGPIEHRLAGRIRAGQIGAAACRPERARPLHHHRTRRHARPYRAHAQGIRRGYRGGGAGARNRDFRHRSGRASPCPIEVPGDPSSAAFPLVAALIVPGSEILLESVMLNPRRIGLIETLTGDGSGHRNSQPPCQRRR